MFWQGIGKCDRVFMDYPSVGGGVTEAMWDRYDATANPTGSYPSLGNEAYNPHIRALKGTHPQSPRILLGSEPVYHHQRRQL